MKGRRQREIWMDWRTIPGYNGVAVDDRVRVSGLGTLAAFKDQLLFRIIKHLDDHSVLSLSRCSRACYWYSEDEYEVWKRRALDRWRGHFVFKGTWKRTALLPADVAEDDIPPVWRPAMKGFYSNYINPYLYRCFVPLDRWAHADPSEIPRRSNLSAEEFIREYDRPRRPVLVTDIVPKWPAFKSWNFEDMMTKYADVKFKTDEVVDGRKIRMPFRNYERYFRLNNDDDPIYMFDPEFQDRAPSLGLDYHPPAYFNEDLLSVLGEDDRPYYRWIVVGPERSGSSFHLDPYMTSAWNALISGRKLWLCYPQNEVPPGVDEDTDSDGEPEFDAPDPIVYLTEEYDAISAAERRRRGGIEFIQEAGEMVFIPTGWWHMVVNLTDTVAVTQNLMNSQNFDVVYADIKKDDEKLKEKLRRRMHRTMPEAYLKFLGHRSQDPAVRREARAYQKELRRQEEAAKQAARLAKRQGEAEKRKHDKGKGSVAAKPSSSSTKTGHAKKKQS